MAYQFTLPGRVCIGKDALELAGANLKKLGRKALIVTGKHVTASGLVAKLEKLLESQAIASSIYNDITGEPTVEMIEKGVEAYRSGECDFLIGIGGGSPLDSVKAIAAMSVLPGNISDYMGKEMEGDFPPMVLIPTTAGTGSETTKFTIITDTQKNVKMLLKGDALLPDVAIIDSSFTMTAPLSVTAATGMDALTHAVESYTSRKGNTFTDMYALSAIKRIFRYLPIAYQEGDNEKAREEMATAAFEAGVCINNASVTLVHGMSRPIGALFHVPHGISNAMLIKECMKFALDGCYGKFADIARAIGAADCMESDKVAAMAFVQALDKLCETLEIPSLEKYGILKDDFYKVMDKMAEDALASGSPSNTIKQVHKEDIITIYQRLWQ